MTDVYARVRQVIRKQINDEERALPENTMFSDHLRFDSVDALELVLNLEDEFRIKIPDDEADRLTTVGDLVTYLEKRLGGR